MEAWGIGKSRGQHKAQVLYRKAGHDLVIPIITERITLSNNHISRPATKMSPLEPINHGNSENQYQNLSREETLI
jgi:hypothetical protein